jgi:hypothetical protein
MPAYYPEGNTPLSEDYTERSLQKINDILNADTPKWDKADDFSYDGNNNMTAVTLYYQGSPVLDIAMQYTGTNLTRIEKTFY